MVTETFKVTFQQLYSTIYNQQPVFIWLGETHLTAVQTSSFSLPSTVVQALIHTLVTHSVSFQGDVLHWIIRVESF